MKSGVIKRRETHCTEALAMQSLLQSRAFLNIKRVDAIKRWFTTCHIKPTTSNPTKQTHPTHHSRHSLSSTHMHTKSYKYTVHSTPTHVGVYLQYQRHSTSLSLNKKQSCVCTVLLSVNTRPSSGHSKRHN